MTYVLIPVRPPETGKTRLSAVLNPAGRAALNWRFFDHVLSVAVRAVSASRCIVISHSADILAAARAACAHGLAEESDGLNAALGQAAAFAQTLGAASVLSLSSDLPMLMPADIDAMIAAGRRAAVVIARDREGVGTNALLLTPPGIMPYLYGEHSLIAHCSRAEAAGLGVEIFDRNGLACDIDTPSDLAAYQNNSSG